MGQFVQRVDDVGQSGALATQRLRLFGVVPDIGIFQLPVYLLQPVPLVSIVKGTP